MPFGQFVDKDMFLDCPRLCDRVRQILLNDGFCLPKLALELSVYVAAV